jgi:hypothetical protein
MSCAWPTLAQLPELDQQRPLARPSRWDPLLGCLGRLPQRGSPLATSQGPERPGAGSDLGRTPPRQLCSRVSREGQAPGGAPPGPGRAGRRAAALWPPWGALAGLPPRGSQLCSSQQETGSLGGLAGPSRAPAVCAADGCWPGTDGRPPAALAVAVGICTYGSFLCDTQEGPMPEACHPLRGRPATDIGPPCYGRFST